jgi:two-component system, chemotaxis family, chemotaxis protein CheY
MSLQVLVVDDSAVLRSMWIRTLRLSGLPISRVLQAATGEEALALVEREVCDLVLVDLDLPGMDGTSLCDAIRRSVAGAQLPCIVIAADGSDPRIGRLAGHRTGCVRKPFTPEEVRAAVLTVLASPMRDAARRSVRTAHAP